MRSEHWTRENLAWLAGLIEGEGCWYWRKPSPNGGRGGLGLSVEMNDLDVLQTAHRIAGVGPAPRHKKVRTTRYGQSDSHQWQVQSTAEVVALMFALFPWMHERRRATIRQLLDRWSCLRQPLRPTASGASSRPQRAA